MIGVIGQEVSRGAQVVIGVDTHQDEHVAVAAIDGQDVRLGEGRSPATTYGYEDLEHWSRSLGKISAFGVKGTCSYGAGFARYLTSPGHTVAEVKRPDHSVRYRKGKSDPTDAEASAHAVLAGATPKSGDGGLEMIRMLKSAKDSAIKGSHIDGESDEPPGCNSPGPAPQNPRRSHHRCSGCAV